MTNVNLGIENQFPFEKFLHLCRERIYMYVFTYICLVLFMNFIQVYFFTGGNVHIKILRRISLCKGGSSLRNVLFQRF